MLGVFNCTSITALAQSSMPGFQGKPGGKLPVDVAPSDRLRDLGICDIKISWKYSDPGAVGARLPLNNQIDGQGPSARLPGVFVASRLGGAAKPVFTNVGSGPCPSFEMKYSVHKPDQFSEPVERGWTAIAPRLTPGSSWEPDGVKLLYPTGYCMPVGVTSVQSLLKFAWERPSADMNRSNDSAAILYTGRRPLPRELSRSGDCQSF